MDSLLKTSGKLVYGNTWAFVQLDDDIIRYYQWFLRRKYHGGLRLHSPKAGAHVTIVRGADVDPISEAKREKYWKAHESRILDLEIDTTTIGFNGEYFWLDVFGADPPVIRSQLGLCPHPRYGLHLTIGKLYPEDVPLFATYRDLSTEFDMS